MIAVTLAAFFAAQTGTAAADSVRGGEYWLHDYGIDRAWSLSEGKGVTVGIVDDIIDESHPDLSGQVAKSLELPGARIQDDTGHGTAVAGLLAGHGHGPNRSQGMIGVAPEAKLVSVVNNTGSAVGEGIRLAAANGAKVVSVSQGTGDAVTCATGYTTPELKRGVAYAEAHDVVVVAAAGNKYGAPNSVVCPALFPGVVAVTGVVKSGAIDALSSAAGPQVVVAAASSTIQTDSTGESGYLVPASGTGNAAANGYRWFQGTSGATPIVAGVAALIRSRYPQMNAASVINRIIRTATDKGKPGRDDVYGYGIVNAYAALTANIPDVTANPLGHVPGGVVPAKPTATKSATADGKTTHGSGPSSTVLASAAGIGVGAAGIIAVLVIRDRRRRLRID